MYTLSTLILWSPVSFQCSLHGFLGAVLCNTLLYVIHFRPLHVVTLMKTSLLSDDSPHSTRHDFWNWYERTKCNWTKQSFTSYNCYIRPKKSSWVKHGFILILFRTLPNMLSSLFFTTKTSSCVFSCRLTLATST